MKSEQFGKKMRRYRIKNDITQEDIARKTGLRVGQISNIERGQTKSPGLRTVLLILKVFGLTFDELMNA